MEIEKPSIGKLGLNYGIILGLVIVTIAVLMYVSGMALEGVQWPVYLYYLIFPALIIYAISQYKKANANSLSLGDSVKLGLAIAVVSGIVYAVYIYLFNYVIDPEFNNQMMEVAREKLAENDKLSEEMLNQSMEWAEKFSNPSIVVTFWLAMSVFFGLIYSLIGGAIMRSND